MALISGLQAGLDPGLRAGLSNVKGAAAQRVFPASSGAWSTYFPTLPSPVEIWTFQEASAPIVGQIAGKDLALGAGVINYQVSGETEPTGAPRYAINYTTNATYNAPADTAYGNIAVGGHMFLLLRFRNPDNAGTSRSVAGKGAAGAARWGLQFNATTGVMRFAANDGAASVTIDTVSAYDDNTYYDVVCGVDSTADVVRLITATEDRSAALPAGLITTIDTTGLAPAQGLRFGAGFNTLQATVGLEISYAALFTSVFTQSHLNTFRTAI